MKKIENLVAGGGRTLLSASVGNELINAINTLGGIRPGKGIKISKADAGFEIELSDQLQKSLVLNGNSSGSDTPDSEDDEGQGPGALRWRGQWSSTKTYERNDIVIHKTTAAINDGTQAGTYILIADENSGTEPDEVDATVQAIWKTFAKGAWTKLVLYDSDGDPTTDTSITLDGSTGNISALTFSGEHLGFVKADAAVHRVTYLGVNEEFTSSGFVTADSDYGTFGVWRESIPAAVDMGYTTINYKDHDDANQSVAVIGYHF